MLDYVIFNALIGDHDVHAKNISLLYGGKTPILAPLYDALSTAVYPALTPRMAMDIGLDEIFNSHAVVERIVELIEQRCAVTIRRLSG